MSESMSDCIEIAKQFAQSLDHEDYQAAAALLSEQCEYICRGQVYRGPQAIIESYRGHGDSASRDFDRIEYASAVSRVADQTALIHFSDHLAHQGQQLTFKCQQLIELSEDGLIVRIEHRDLPGQREALQEFMQRVSVLKAGDG